MNKKKLKLEEGINPASMSQDQYEALSDAEQYAHLIKVSKQLITDSYAVIQLLETKYNEQYISED